MGSTGAKAQRADRRAKIEQMRRAQQARERRNRILTYALSGVIVAGIAGGAWYAVQRVQEKDRAAEAAAAAPVKGVRTFKDLGRNHVTEAVSYKMSPPVGGDHDPGWMNCNGDVYDKEIGKGGAVHALEHGAVWVTYTKDATAKDVEAMKKRVENTPYTLMSPYTDQKTPLVLSAWGKQLSVKSASDPRVQAFLDKYVQGEQTPEPGAACTGGKSA